MTSQSITPFYSFERLGLFAWIKSKISLTAETDTLNDEDGARLRQDFVREMLDRSSDAFASELDVQHMMRMFPDRF